MRAMHANEVDADDIRHAQYASWGITPQDAFESARNQQTYFKTVDRCGLDPPLAVQPSSSKAQISFDTALSRACSTLPRLAPSPTAVMQAAFHLLQSGMLNIPDVGTINVKQARAFLWNAAWLQHYMIEVWEAQQPFQRNSSATITFANYCLAIMGPGGTGKTAVLKLSEALIAFFVGPNAVRKLAPSNAAARLLHGDTLHALCKLPFGNVRLSSKKGRLRQHVLKAHRKQWSSAIAAFIDEISMVPANQFLQCDVRFRQAKMKADVRFGGLALNVCGASCSFHQ